MRLLITAGANLNAVDEVRVRCRSSTTDDRCLFSQNNATALYNASFKGLVDIVHVLLEAGADPNIKADVPMQPVPCLPLPDLLLF